MLGLGKLFDLLKSVGDKLEVVIKLIKAELPGLKTQFTSLVKDLNELTKDVKEIKDVIDAVSK